MSLPNFLCLGAAKSGTTTLYEILRQHPDIYVPSFKEPHYFDIPENYFNGIEWYEKNYFKNINKKIIADFTPSYFFEKEAPKRIFEDLGEDVKFVVILRNPVDRAYSHYLHSKRDDHESLSFDDAIECEDERLFKFHQEKNYLSILRNSYIHQGLYADMLERYLEYFKLDNFLFIHFEEELLINIDNTINSILNFLDLDMSYPLKTDIKSNPASIEKSKKIKKLIKKNGLWRRILKWLIPSVQFRQILRNKIQTFNTKEVKIDALTEDFKKNTYKKYFYNNISKFEILSKRKMNW